MNDVKGRFYMKLTTTGNLIGEYSNNFTTEPLPESAWRKSETEVEKTFVGTYKSTWHEPELSKAIIANLKISEKEEHSNIFSLEWKDDEKQILFEGEAMCCEDLLIGNYWSHNSSSPSTPLRLAGLNTET